MQPAVSIGEAREREGKASVGSSSIPAHCQPPGRWHGAALGGCILEGLGCIPKPEREARASLTPSTQRHQGRDAATHRLILWDGASQRPSEERELLPVAQWLQPDLLRLLS